MRISKFYQFIPRFSNERKILETANQKEKNRMIIFNIIIFLISAIGIVKTCIAMFKNTVIKDLGLFSLLVFGAYLFFSGYGIIKIIL